jgi:hypothetical protein
MMGGAEPGSEGGAGYGRRDRDMQMQNEMRLRRRHDREQQQLADMKHEREVSEFRSAETA